MKRIVGAAAAALMAAALLTGCGGSDDNGSGPDQSGNTTTTSGGATTSSGATTSTGGDDNGASGSYCDDLKTAQATVTALGGSTMTQASFDKAATALHAIADEAPAEVADDWGTLADTIDAIQTALQAAGVSFDDLDKIGQPGGPTLDPGAITALTQALAGMDQTKLSAAFTNINAEVTKDCSFSLGIGG